MRSRGLDIVGEQKRAEKERTVRFQLRTPKVRTDELGCRAYLKPACIGHERVTDEPHALEPRLDHRRGQVGLFVAFAHHRLGRRVAGRDASGDRVVELGRPAAPCIPRQSTGLPNARETYRSSSRLLGRRSSWNPDVILAALDDVSCEPRTPDVQRLTNFAADESNDDDDGD